MLLSEACGHPSPHRTVPSRNGTTWKAVRALLYQNLSYAGCPRRIRSWQQFRALLFNSTPPRTTTWSYSFATSLFLISLRNSALALQAGHLLSQPGTCVGSLIARTMQLRPSERRSVPPRSGNASLPWSEPTRTSTRRTARPGPLPFLPAWWSPLPPGTVDSTKDRVESRSSCPQASN